MEQDEEQHWEQGEAEEVGGGCLQNRPDQEEAEKRQTQHSHFWWRMTARFHQLYQQACKDLKYPLSSSVFSHLEANDRGKIL